MKKKLTRMTACFMAALIAVNLVAIPKAKAVVTEAAIGTAALASYMTATGVPLTVVSGGAGAASAGVTALASGYAAATGTTSAAVMGSIAAGTTITTGGLIIIGVAAAALLAGIVAWAISEYGLEDAEESVFVGPEIEGYESYNGVVLPEIPVVDGYPYAIMSSDSVSLFDSPLYYAHFSGSDYAVFTSAACNRKWYTLSSDGASWTFYKDRVMAADAYVLLEAVVTWSSHDIANSDGVVKITGTDPVYAVDSDNSIGIELDENYETPPEVTGQHTMVINTGLTAEDEQGIIDAVLEGIAAGTFAPAYTIEVDSSGDSGEDSGDDSVTDPDADTQIGLLERIANGIDGLAEEIKDGIASIFAPDVALMTEISSTFSDKFGFVSTLHTLGTDLLSLEADASPPVIYINLDDAEGQFYYGGQVVALDLSWYSRYKEDVDRIMSGFLWLGFLWLVFKRASAIIQGAEMVNDYSADLDRGFRFRGERNGKHF